MHSAEQILRAELAEKRHLLKNIRKELEETRASWLVVKQKNAESEIQWLKLKADCDERRRILMSSSESGFSELCNSDKTDDTDTESVDKTSQVAAEKDVEEENSTTVLPEEAKEEETEDDEESSESEEIPDPFSDDENEVEEIPQHFVLPILTEADLESEYDDEEEEEEDVTEAEPEKEKSPSFTPIFVPSMSYLAGVPADMQPQLLTNNEKELRGLEEPRPSRDRLEENVLEEVDDNVRDLIIRLSSSTARGAFLANRLADIHRRIATGTSLTDHNDWFDNEETETDASPREEVDEEDELTVPSPEIQSDFEDIAPLEEDKEAEEEMDEEEELSRPSSVDSLVLAIDEAINILDPVNSHPQLGSFLSLHSVTSPAVTDTARPSFLTLSQPDTEDEGEDGGTDLAGLAVPGAEGGAEGAGAAGGAGGAGGSQDSSTAVTRYLIKHLPKQLTQLRNQKHELEDKITDLEQVISEQRTQNAEYERRAELERSRARRLEERLKEIEEKVTASEARIDNVTLPVTYKVRQFYLTMYEQSVRSLE